MAMTLQSRAPLVTHEMDKFAYISTYRRDAKIAEGRRVLNEQNRKMAYFLPLSSFQSFRNLCSWIAAYFQMMDFFALMGSRYGE